MQLTAKAFIFILLVLAKSGIATAQQTGNAKIKGLVLDSSTRKTLEYASIAVKELASGKTTGGALANSRGLFVIEGLTLGSYELEIDFVGYTIKKLGPLVLTKDKPVLDIGTISLMANGSNLQNVVITGRPPIVENKTDRVVFNAANDITSQGGAAIDVLRKVPQVTVDVDGSVELQGNPNVRFLINGKPSSMFGHSLVDALASIPASQIKSIEAITSPGAKYDAQGTGGIINIILKDNKAKGVNGSVNLTGGSRLQNGALGFNFRHNNFGISSYLNGNLQLPSHTPYSQERSSHDSMGRITQLSQNGYSDFKRNGYQAGTSFDWDLSKKDNLNASLTFNRFSNSSTGIIGVEEIAHGSGGTIDSVVSERFSESSFHSSALDWSVAYRHKFNKEGAQLDALYSASQGSPYGQFLQHQTFAGQPYPYAGSSSSNPGKDFEQNFSIDYSQPVNENISIDAGVKFVWQNIESKTEANLYKTLSHEYEPDSLLSYELYFRQRVYAAYVSAKFPLTRFLNISAGLRYEYTVVHTTPSNVQIPSYGNLMPSIIISHPFADNILKLAYSRRLERADYEDLNPFLNVSDPYNISTGNPLLKPEIGDNIELGFSRNLKKGGNIYVALVERINSQDHKQFTQFYPSFIIGDSAYENVSVTTRANIGTEYNSGVIITGSFQLIKNLNIRENIMFTHKYYSNNINAANTTGLAFRFNVNMNYQLPHNLLIEAFGDYRSPTKSIQGTQAQRITYTLALRKQFLDKKASIGLTATNPFNRYIKQQTTTITDNYTATTIRKIPYQSFGINFNYRFGKLQFKKDKDHESDFLNNPPAM